MKLIDITVNRIYKIEDDSHNLMVSLYFEPMFKTFKFIKRGSSLGEVAEKLREFSAHLDLVEKEQNEHARLERSIGA